MQLRRRLSGFGKVKRIKGGDAINHSLGLQVSGGEKIADDYLGRPQMEVKSVHRTGCHAGRRTGTIAGGAR